MSDDFKKRLSDYTEGKLSAEEKAEVEREMEKLEQYQRFIEEELGSREVPDISGNPEMFDGKKEAGIIKKAKWKARIHNALTALAIIFAGAVLCGIITTIFYTAGEPDRISVYRDVVQSTIAVTEPNLMLRGGGTGVNSFFGMDLKGQLQKEIGGESVDAGDIQMSFFFNQVRYPERRMLLAGDNTWPFLYPTSPHRMNSEWGRLDKLPEGTVAEAFLSFSQFFTTDEVLKKFKDKNMKPVWFVVDTGFDDITVQPGASFIGFPYQPVWHESDMTVTNRTYKETGLFNRVVAVTESASSPSIEDYGSADLRNENFMKTLELLRSHENVANRIALGGELRIAERINYLNKHGVRIYGIVVTGPSKEILKLREEGWIAGMHLGEVRLWNWEE